MCLHGTGVGVASSRGVPRQCRPCRPAKPKVGTPCCRRLWHCMPLPLMVVAAWINGAIGGQQRHGGNVSPNAFHPGSKSNTTESREQAAGPEMLRNCRKQLGSSTQGGVQQLLTCTPDTPPPPLGVRLVVVVRGRLLVVPYSVFSGAVLAVWRGLAGVALLSCCAWCGVRCPLERAAGSALLCF